MGTVAVAGFMHETNTFSPVAADLAAFTRPATLPGLTLGAAMPTVFAGLNVPVSGAMRALRARGHTVLPIVWASAVPCGRVSREAFETIAGRIVDGIAAARPLDGVYLDLHGAMVAEHFEDPEAELLRRLRAVVGLDVPIAASFDLHANLSPARLALLDAATVFRTYPHLDMAETGARAALLLIRWMGGERFRIAHRRVPYLIPLHAQSTRQAPVVRLYAQCADAEAAPGVASADIAMGFPSADVPFCGPTVMVTGNAPNQAADMLAQALLAAEPDFAADLPGPEEAVRQALAAPRGPVVIADAQDNPGAGGTGDTVGLLRVLLEVSAPDAVLALLHDPAAARLAHTLGAGATARFRLGAHSGAVDEAPVEAEFTVERLTDGHITAVGPMYRGNRWEIGATALLRRGGVRVLIAERRLQAADTSVLRHAGIDPAACGIVVLKSTAHFRAEWEDIATRIIVCAAPGLHLADLCAYPYRRLPPELRRMPQTRP